MSTLCIYGCGTYTDEPDDICRGCKGFSSIKKIKTSPPVREEKGPSSDGPKTEGEGDMSKKKPCSTAGCGRASQKEGLCYICFKKEYGVPPYPQKRPENSSKVLPTKKPVPLNKQCSVKGCGKYKVRNGMCIGHDKEARLHLSLDNTKPMDKKGKISEPEIKNVIPAKAGIQAKDNGKNLCAGQLLYASDLLDGQIESALDSGIVDTNILLNIRKRIGAIVMGGLSAEAIA